MLGFLHDWPKTRAEFFPTTDFRARGPDHRHQYSVKDCRHGRVLLSYKDDNQPTFVVWDPITGGQTVLCRPEMSGASRWQASLLCAADSCIHGDCHSGPFVVVFVTLDEQEGVATASAYSSETSTWCSPALTAVAPFEEEIDFYDSPSVLVGDALYFLVFREQDDEVIEDSILKYDLGKSCLSEILLPEEEVERASNNPILMVGEDGRLGITHLFFYCLSVWWREVDPDGVASWTQRIDIDLKTDLFPLGNFSIPPELGGSVEGTGIIFVISKVGTYMIDLKSQSSKRLSSKLYQHPNVRWSLFPYVSFYYPPGTTLPMFYMFSPSCNLCINVYYCNTFQLVSQIKVASVDRKVISHRTDNCFFV
uniref:F-box protein AT5G49610-like beta-propeller domain-containing protein n=1 Tax=Aegilops tauschii subsp. strangulata TaxID=200361 RepID=A0A452ZBG8_AEGTS